MGGGDTEVRARAAGHWHRVDHGVEDDDVRIEAPLCGRVVIQFPSPVVTAPPMGIHLQSRQDPAIRVSRYLSSDADFDRIVLPSMPVGSYTLRIVLGAETDASGELLRVDDLPITAAEERVVVVPADALDVFLRR